MVDDLITQILQYRMHKLHYSTPHIMNKNTNIHEIYDGSTEISTRNNGHTTGMKSKIKIDDDCGKILHE